MFLMRCSPVGVLRPRGNTCQITYSCRIARVYGESIWSYMCNMLDVCR